MRECGWGVGKYVPAFTRGLCDSSSVASSDSGSSNMLSVARAPRRPLPAPAAVNGAGFTRARFSCGSAQRSTRAPSTPGVRFLDRFRFACAWRGGKGLWVWVGYACRDDTSRRCCTSACCASPFGARRTLARRTTSVDAMRLGHPTPRPAAHLAREVLAAPAYPDGGALRRISALGRPEETRPRKGVVVCKAARRPVSTTPPRTAAHDIDHRRISMAWRSTGHAGSVLGGRPHARKP